MLRILLGRARTGKSARVLEEIRALGDSSQQILLVPEHASHVAEVDVCRACGVTASRHAEVLTFKLLASRVLTLTGGAAEVTLDNGGKLGKNLIYVADYAQKDTPNIDAFLAEWGIKVDSGVLYDSNTENLTAIGGTVPAIYTAVTDENYTEKLAQPSLPVLVPLSRPIKTLFDTKDTRSTEVILSTYSTGYAVTEDMLNEDGTLDKSKITEQNYNVMVMGKKYYYENNVEVYSKVLAIGSSMMLDEYLTSLSYINNGEYFVEVVNDMCGKDSGISIVAKDFTAETFDMTKKDLTVNLLVFIVIIPAAIIITCVVVCVRRRNR